MKTTFIGIDPGLKGGVAFIRGDKIKVYDMPTLAAGTKSRRVLDIRELAHLLEKHTRGPSFAGYEEQIAMPRQSSQSTAKIFRQLGAIEGILTTLKISCLPPVRSTMWKKVILKGMPKGGKEVSVLYVQIKYPDVELVPKGSKNPRDGRSDALCIAEYARMTYTQEIL